MVSFLDMKMLHMDVTVTPKALPPQSLKLLMVSSIMWFILLPVNGRYHCTFPLKDRIFKALVSEKDKLFSQEHTCVFTCSYENSTEVQSCITSLSVLQYSRKKNCSSETMDQNSDTVKVGVPRRVKRISGHLHLKKLRRQPWESAGET